MVARHEVAGLETVDGEFGSAVLDVTATGGGALVHELVRGTLDQKLFRRTSPCVHGLGFFR